MYNISRWKRLNYLNLSLFVFKYIKYCIMFLKIGPNGPKLSHAAHSEPKDTLYVVNPAHSTGQLVNSFQDQNVPRTSCLLVVCVFFPQNYAKTQMNLLEITSILQMNDFIEILQIFVANIFCSDYVQLFKNAYRYGNTC
jgi:hypothetical protein